MTIPCYDLVRGCSQPNRLAQNNSGTLVIPFCSEQFERSSINPGELVSYWNIDISFL